jgi:hypothetical protein
MRNNTVYFIIIGVGVVVGLVMLGLRMLPEEEKIEPPQVLAEQILQSKTPVKQRAIAARKMIVHGRAARPEIRRVVESYKGNDPEVIIPLVQATAKANNYQSIPRLFELMEHPDVRIRGKAGAAVRKMMGADYGFRATDSKQKREEKLNMMRRAHGQMLNDGVLSKLYDGKD